jgi:putative oxidoreductase
MLNGIIPASWSGPLHAVLRIVAGLLLLEHGTSKYFNLPATEYFADGVEVFSLMGLAGALEIIGGILIILGLFTRITAFVLAGFLAAAYFMGHAPQSFFPLQNQGDAAILFCFIFLYFSAAGAGPYSLDANRK